MMKRSYFEAFLYGIPVLGLAILVIPSSYVLSGIYASEYGLPLASIGGVLLASKLFDAITDPIIGIWSDRLRRRSGNRKRLIAAGAVITIVSAWFLYVPLTHLAGVGWFCIWFFGLYLGMTLIAIPYTAWAADLSSDARGRSLFYSASTVGQQVGAGLFFLTPFLPIFETQKITPDVLKVSTLIGVALMGVGFWVCLRYLPGGNPAISAPKIRNCSDGADGALRFLYAFVQNGPFLNYLGIYGMACIGNGAWIGLFFIYVDSYLGLGGQFAAVSVIGTIAGLVAALSAREFMLRLGAKVTMLISVSSLLGCYVVTGLLDDTWANTYVLALVFACNSFSMGVFVIVASTMLASIADYGALKSGRQDTGGYFSVMTFMAKVQFAVGSGIGLAIAGWFGFNAVGAHAPQTVAGVFGLKLGAAWAPALFACFSLIFIFHMPLGERQMDTIRRALERKLSRFSAGDRSTETVFPKYQ